MLNTFSYYLRLNKAFKISSTAKNVRIVFYIAKCLNKRDHLMLNI